MSECVVMGNGPSSELYDGGVNYACNVSGIKYGPEYLYAVDPWAQFDIVKSEYGGKCRFRDFVPIPIDIPITAEVLNQGGDVPLNYDRLIHNPEHESRASGWVYYCTGETMNENWTERLNNDQGYWAPRRVYILYVFPEMQIENVPRLEQRGNIAPTGAYALQGAIDDGHVNIDVYGFDSIANSYKTTSRKNWQTDDKLEETRGERFRMHYDLIIQNNPNVNITWKGIDA